MVVRKPIVNIPMRPRRSSKQGGVHFEKPDDMMLTLRRVSETLGVHRMKELYVHKPDSKLAKCRAIVLLTLAVVTTAWGIGSLIYTPLQMLLSIRLDMTPGLPPFEWWLKPPDEVLLKVYVFNITNSEEFINGTHKKLRVQEIGPIIYREKLLHLNPVHNPNGTLTYASNKTLVYLPEMNTINLNDTIIVPNLGVLLIPAYFHDTSMFVKLGVNVLLRTYNAQPLVKMTIQDFLWNATDPILTPAKNLAPSLVPTKNVGLLSIIYTGFQNNVSLFIGKEHGNSKFFTIDTYDGSEYLPHFSNPKCQLKFRNASEGAGYPQMITKDTNLTYWRKTLCKQADIRYKREDRKYGMNAYRFELVPWAFDRTEWEGNQDCFAGNPVLPNGIADVSACYWGFPIAVSFPHYLYAEEKTKSYVEGLNPNEKDHASFVLIEPITGIPFGGEARCQMNLVLPKLGGFPKRIQAFSDMFLPLGWLEYNQVGIPLKIQWMAYCTSVIVPIIQVPLSLLSLSLGGVCIYFMALQMLGRTIVSTKDRPVKNKINKNRLLLKRESQALIDYTDCEGDI